MEITQKILRDIFDYDPEGYLVWKPSLNNQFAGQRAGGEHKDYWEIQLTRFNKKCRAHRLIFLWHHGYLPNAPLTIDHANRNKLDNRIENLREATQTQQNANKPVDPRSLTKLKGVQYDSARDRYRAVVTKDGVKYRSKRFKTPEEAHAAYIELANKLFGSFAHSG